MSYKRQLALALEVPEITQEQAERIFDNPACTESMNESAWLFYGRGLSCAQVAERQGCSRSPVIKRLKTWRERAKASLEEDR